MAIRPNLKTIYLSIFILLFVPLETGALQNAVTPFDASHLEPHRATYTFSIVDSSGIERDGGTWTDEVRIEDHSLTRSVIRFRTDRQADLQRTIVADRVTLLPTTMDQRFGAGLEGVMHVDYRPESVDQFMLANPASVMRQVQATFDRPVWELSLWGTLAMSLPLDQTGSYTVPTIAHDRISVRDVIFEVGQEERIDLNGTLVLTRRVQIPEEGWTFWVRDTAPYLVQIEHPIPGDGYARSRLQSEFTQ
ncbi:hypothetical protein V0U79_10805 [Hyphobacterium sp. HN65]|uniref:DUF3108 domain-containing protein n=1 Tax=Hyphobacterium lacteum TaxID=3116575 RepID=A0ABU7LT90_9PROT|nr:hypothetical protein [Hyphobacterium sp. HN65]MEE2526861.1 hypothetical protein [Hyphobacterium sp. HN65]